jgi:hypothetical protein
MYSLPEVASLLAQQHHPIIHLLNSGRFPEMEGANGRRAFSADDVLRLAAALDLPAEQVRQAALRMAGDGRSTQRTGEAGRRRRAVQGRGASERAGLGQQLQPRPS